MVSYLDTTPYCGSCGWDFVLENLAPGYRCDACGNDLSFNAADIGPDNPPSVATAAAASLAVTFSYTAAPNFDSYNFRYQIDGGAYVYLEGAPATDSPISVTAAEGEEVCGQLQGVTDGKASAWAAADCATALA